METITKNMMINKLTSSSSHIETEGVDNWGNHFLNFTSSPKKVKQPLLCFISLGVSVLVLKLILKSAETLSRFLLGVRFTFNLM